MPDLFTFTEQGMRELVAAFRAQKNEMANLRRLAQMTAAQQPLIYMPAGATQVALADFRAHEIPDTAYPYPVPSDGTEDIVFPAYIQRDVTFDDATGFDVDQDVSYPGSTDYDAEPVFVYSLRGTYIPPRLTTLENLRLHPIFKINDKWFCDYKPNFRASFTVFTTTDPAAGQTKTFDSSGALQFYEGVPNSTYAPIKISSSGVITAYRDVTAMISFTAIVQSAGFTSDTQSINGVIQKTAGSTISVGYRVPDGYYTFAPIDNPTLGETYDSNTSVTVSSRGWVSFAAGDNLQFEIDNYGAGGGVVVTEMHVTIEPLELKAY